MPGEGIPRRARAPYSRTVPADPKQVIRWGLEHAVPRLLVRWSARRGDARARLFFAAEHLENDELADLYEQLRAEPVQRGRLGFLTVDHAVVREVLSSPDFRTGFPSPGDGALARLYASVDFTAVHPLRPPSLLATEPPDHTRYRGLVATVFTTRAVEGLRERIGELADGLLTELADRPPGSVVDLVTQYCGRLPVMVIAEILGVPEEDHAEVTLLGHGAAASLDFGLPYRQVVEVEASLVRFDRWLDAHIARLRRRPGQDLMSRLIEVSDEQGRLDQRELKATAGLVLAAGFETTVNLMGHAIALLAEHPDQLDVLRAHPDHWANAVDETLRFDPPVLLTGRTCRRPTTVAGLDIPANAMVTTVLAGANRDPAVFAEPATYDVRRSNARDHLSFSAGRHRCLGAALARLESEIGLRSLHDRFTITLLPGRRRRPTRLLRGFEYLPARLEPRRD